MVVSALEHQRALQEGVGKPELPPGQENPCKCRSSIEVRAGGRGALRE